MTAPRSFPAAPHRAWCGAAIALLAALPYLNGLHGDFVFDDAIVVRDNPSVTQGAPTALLTSVYALGAVYRPLTMLTYAANHRVSPDPFGYHVVNLGLHVLVCLALFALVLELLGSLPAASAAAALFAVHPVHTEAVTSMVGRAELLAALLVFIALFAQVRAVRQSSRRWSAFGVGSFALALLAKESAFTAIALAAAVAWWIDPRRSVRRVLRATAPFAVVGLAYLPLRWMVVGALGWPYPPPFVDNPLAHVPAWPRIGTALVVLYEYCSLLFLPINLVADYSYNQIPIVTSPFDGRLLLAAAVLLAAGAGVAAAVRHAPALALAAAFASIPLALTANVLFPIGTIKAERLLYLPSAGWCLAAGWLFAAALRRRPMAAVAAVVIATFAFAVRTWVRNADWRDDLALFSAAVEGAPNSSKVHHNLAVALQRAGRLDEALAHYRETLRIYPDYAAAAFGIGHIHALRGDDAGAVYWYHTALHRDWQLCSAHLQLGLVHERRREYTAAEAAFTTGLAIEPGNPLLLVNLAAARLAQGDRWGARAALEQLDHSAPAPDANTRALVTAVREEIEGALR
ncbi:MAG: tetratricopeptide repeat protein [Candidatus Binatia bacterium]